MTKKLFIAALAMLVAAPFAFADNACTSGTPVPQVIAVGSSAQFNATAYAAKAIIGAGYQLFSVKGKDIAGTGAANVLDHRISGDPADGATLWVMWDGGSPCHFWAYYSTDSTVGVKDFFAYGKASNGKSVAFAYGSLSGLEDGASSANWCTGTSSCSQNKVFGLSDNSTVNGGDNLPTSIIAVLNAHPDGTGSAPSWCASGVFCYFNAAATDIRPEDALFASTRALTTYDSKALKGLGYNALGCGGTSNLIGCPIYSSMGTGSKFYVSSFKLSGSDPIASGSVPASVTLPVGASPIVVFVNNQDTAGFGATSGSNYVFTNINRETLSEVFQGNLGHTGDLLTTSASTSATGQPIQVIQREPLSGTYNTFEFTGVRTLSGSARTPAAASSTSIQSNSFSGQEIGINPATNNYVDHAANCPSASGSFPDGTVQCTDPLWISTSAGGLRLRAIGTGEEVPAVVNQAKNQAASHSAAPDGIGYAFWSFGNMKPAVSFNSSNVVVGYLGHYLTVDGIDPLFNRPDDGTNLSGAYNMPVCLSPPCTQVIPFTHIQDGTYPLWSLLRTVTFKSVPAAVSTLVNQEISQSNTDQLDEYFPLLDGSGNLQLFVFRSHFKNTNNPVNGHKTCTSFSPPAPSSCLSDAGGDVGGSIFTVQADVDFALDSGGLELVGVSQ
ncbi:MAG TPA: hypothetical protein VE377_04180 [Candidatus Dormibacteraeota bacterium]|nr:hypothetical protein [Candidatus Dormibacteraeota bacterium]